MLLGVILDKNNSLLLISELCEQQSIKKFLEKFKGKTPVSVKLRMIFDIAKALYYLHSRKEPLLHRDLKPENIFLTADLRAKLGDFG